MYAAAETKVPAGYAIASILQFEPPTDKGEGFAGDFTVRTEDKSVSVTQGSSFGEVYRCVWDSRSQVWNAFRSGFYSQDPDGELHFDLDYLGIVMLLKPIGSQFQVAAFADVASTPINSEVNFWVIQRNGNLPVTYEWDFGDGTTSSGAEVSHSYPLIADYNVTLTATDSSGNTAPVASTPISVVGNPVLLTEVDVTVTANGDGTFDYSATLNGGSPPFEYAWDLDGEGTVDSREGAHLVWSPRSNLYRGSLTVTDQTGASATTEFITDARQIAVEATTVAGALLTGDPQHSYAPEIVHTVVTTQGTNSFDTITIDFGDGTSETYVDPIDHALGASGVYTFTATVTRSVPGFGNISRQSAPAVVILDDRPAPVIDSVTPARATVGSEITLAGNFFFLPEVDDQVLLNDLPMPVVSWDYNQIVVTVPQGAKDGNIHVEKGVGALDSNPYLFDVAPTPPGQPGTGQL
jgi:PKD repeat protein